MDRRPTVQGTQVTANAAVSGTGYWGIPRAGHMSGVPGFTGLLAKRNAGPGCRSVLWLWLVALLVAAPTLVARQSGELRDSDLTSEPCVFVGIVERVTEHGGQETLVVQVVRVLKGKTLPTHVVVRPPGYGRRVRTGQEAVWFGDFDGTIFSITDEECVAPGVDAAYFAAVLGKDFPSSLLSLIEKKDAPVVTRCRALHFLNGGDPPWPWHGDTQHHGRESSPSVRLGTEDLQRIAKVALSDDSMPVALLAFAVYASASSGVGETKENLLEAMWKQRHEEGGFCLLAIIWHYWGDETSVLREGTWSRLANYDSEVAQEVLPLVSWPMETVAGILLSQMLEDDTVVAASVIWEEAPTGMGPEETGGLDSVGGHARRLLHREIGTWLPFDVDASIALLTSPQPARQPALTRGFGVQTPPSARLELRPADRLALRVKNVTSVEVIVAAPTMMDVTSPKVLAWASLVADGTVTTPITLAPHGVVEIPLTVRDPGGTSISRLGEALQSSASMVRLCFPKPVCPAGTAVWFGVIGVPPVSSVE